MEMLSRFPVHFPKNGVEQDSEQAISRIDQFAPLCRLNAPMVKNLEETFALAVQ